MKKLITGLFLLTTFYTFGQGLTIDTTFGKQGKISSSANRTASLIDSNGDLIVGGVYTSAGLTISKYNSSGKIDETFGTSGVVRDRTVLDNFISLRLAEQNGKYLIACTNGILRYNRDGTPDNTFGNNGLLSMLMPRTLFIQPDNKILISTTQGVIRRYLPDGQLDLTFNQTGEFRSANIASIVKIAVDKNGVIYAAGSKSSSAAGYDIVIASLNSNGTVNTDFGTNGFFTNNYQHSDEASSLLVLNEKLYVSGHYSRNSRTDYVLLCMNLNGVLDSTFGSNGMCQITFNDEYYYNIPSNLISAPNGDFYLGGKSFDGNGVTKDYGYVVRITSNGMIDRSFHFTGYYQSSNDCNSIHLLDNGSLILTGEDEYNGGSTVFLLKQGIVTSLNSSTSNNVVLYPNPTKNYFKLSLNSTDLLESIEIMDINGRTVKRFNSIQDNYQVNDLAAGTYMVNISLSNQTITEKIIIRK